MVPCIDKVFDKKSAILYAGNMLRDIHNKEIKSKINT